jgi:hypothetical protein
MSGVRHRKRKVGCETASGADRSNVALMCGGGLLSTDSLQIVLGGAVCLAHLQIFCIPGPCSSVPCHTRLLVALPVRCLLPACSARAHVWSLCCLAAASTLFCFASKACHIAVICLTAMQCAILCRTWGRAPTRGLWVIVGHTAGYTCVAQPGAVPSVLYLARRRRLGYRSLKQSALPAWPMITGSNSAFM